MEVKLVLFILVFMCITWNVEGKAVGKRIKRAAYPEYSYSLYPQWMGPTQKAAEPAYWYKPSATGTSNHQYYNPRSKSKEYTEKNYPTRHSDTIYESHKNLEPMSDSKFVPQGLQNSQESSHVEELGKPSPLGYDQAFLKHEKDKSKYTHRKVKPNLSKSYSIGGPKNIKKNKTSSVSTVYSKVNTNLHKGKVKSSMSTTQLPTSMQKLEIEQPSDDLAFNSGLGSIPTDLIQESNDLNQRNLPTDDESDVSMNEDSEVKDTARKVSDNFATRLQENQLSAKGSFNSVVNNEDKNLFRIGIKEMFESNFDSFVFNPSAQPLEKFQECQTPKNESGNCRYVQHCMLPNILNSIQHFMENVCIIQGRFIGVCCPEFPVQTVMVKWEDQPEELEARNDAVEIPEECGIGTNTRIVGGHDADRKAWPWMVALLNNKKKFFCGGSLINNRYVLTAAHCTFGASKNQIVARLGEYDFNDPREPHDDYRVVEMKRHGQYNSLNLRNDIALLKLDKPVVFNEFVQTICFPETAKDYVDDVATLVGWGHLNGVSGGTSEVLQEASFPVTTNEECSTTHGIPIPSSLICAAAPSRDKGACNGDSGGPLMLLDENDRWKVIGIVSWGRRGCSPKFPTVYTRVTHFMDWIKKHSK